MHESTVRERPPLGIRVMHALGREPNWMTMTADDLIALSRKVNRKRASRAARLITGFPDPGATIEWQDVVLHDRTLRVRVYRPPTGHPADGDREMLPLVLHIHGGGFVGTAVQSDWANSHFAGCLPAVVVSVEHRLIAPGTALPAAVDDGWDVLRHVIDHAADWGIDAHRAVVVGESAGALMCALAAIRAREAGLQLRGQVLVNPVVDLTAAGFEYASVREHADSPTLNLRQMEFFRELAVPPGVNPRGLSPICAVDLSGLAPAFIAVAPIDPVADHGRCYAHRLRTAGTPVRLTEYPGATHAFLSMPGVVPQAKAARAEILEFLRGVFS
ncbi:alpha/beta hydrolase [Rhodococcus sp. (in: high G+C Gram-positive bacteria)]|uniref:alpha/beta hydrolase n=1 Tax=Rhodococcus sp. TaxID=1831 RepID=UPI003B8A700C